jgi:hypothetical protein
MLCAEGGAVGALAHGGVSLVGGNLDLIKGAVIVASGMICALCNGAFDALVISAGILVVHDTLRSK